MSAESDDLTPKQERALLELLAHGEVKKAAEAADVGEATLHRWLGQPLFVERYREARAGLVESALARLEACADVAINTLRDICEDAGAPATARIAAARAILSNIMRSPAAAQSQQPFEQHKHSCSSCMKRGEQKVFMCSDPSCASFEFGTCPDCRAGRVQRDM
jgi:hypothetical protein